MFKTIKNLFKKENVKEKTYICEIEHIDSGRKMTVEISEKGFTGYVLGGWDILTCKEKIN